MNIDGGNVQTIDADLIQDSYDVIRAIEEALAANDPYNNPDYDPEYEVSLQDCELPDCIEDPLLLLRLVLGDEQTEHLEYVGDLELIANALREVCGRVQARGGTPQGEESDQCREIQGETDSVC